MWMRRFCKLMYLETLVNAWSFLLALEQILATCSLKVRSLSVLTPNNTSSLLAFIVDPIIFIGLSTNGLSKKWNFPGLALKPLWWNHCTYGFRKFVGQSKWFRSLHIDSGNKWIEPNMAVCYYHVAYTFRS